MKSPVEARQYAVINCLFYSTCRDALAHTDIKAEMACHRCAGVIEENCFRKEMGADYFANKDPYIEFPLRMPY